VAVALGDVLGEFADLYQNFHTRSAMKRMRRHPPKTQIEMKMARRMGDVKLAVERESESTSSSSSELDFFRRSMSD